MKTRILEVSYQTFLQSKSERLAVTSFLLSLLCLSLVLTMRASRLVRTSPTTPH